MLQQSYCPVTWLSSSSLHLVMWLAVSQAQVHKTVISDGTLGTSVSPNGNLLQAQAGKMNRGLRGHDAS
jgi:hypothetical protein